MKKKILSANQNTGTKAASSGGSGRLGIQGMPSNGLCHPPRKSNVATQAAVNMLAYSAMKNMANFMALYSVWYPATSSVSASGRSKGIRLVSAKAEVK